MNNIRLYAFHGCLEEEALIGGNYIVDIKIYTDYSKAAKNDELSSTVDRFNHDVGRGTDAFGRGLYVWDRFSAGGAQARPLGDPPYYAARLLPGCLGTKGGLKTDEHGRVLAADGSGAIDGLFAAGNAAANPFGCAYPGPGSTIGPALVFGSLAGEAAAQS